jgi:hypothetical protein
MTVACRTICFYARSFSSMRARDRNRSGIDTPPRGSPAGTDAVDGGADAVAEVGAEAYAGTSKCKADDGLGRPLVVPPGRGPAPRCGDLKGCLEGAAGIAALRTHSCFSTPLALYSFCFASYCFSFNSFFNSFTRSFAAACRLSCLLAFISICQSFFSGQGSSLEGWGVLQGAVAHGLALLELALQEVAAKGPTAGDRCALCRTGVRDRRLPCLRLRLRERPRDRLTRLRLRERLRLATLRERLLFTRRAFGLNLEVAGTWLVFEAAGGRVGGGLGAAPPGGPATGAATAAATGPGLRLTL